MEGIGKIKDISRSMTGGFTIVMEVADMKLEELKKLCGCERLTISIPKRQKSGHWKQIPTIYGLRHR